MTGGTGQARLDEIANLEFHGPVAKKITEYTVANQRFAHDIARELDAAASAAESAMRELKGHPMLRGLDVRRRARRVARELADARELAQGISAEMVKFNLQFRREFLEALRDGERPDKGKYKGKVDL